jgi:AcrR family transcriptional regulator
MPRHPDPELEQRILTAASRLWARGGEKALTMRAIARSAGTTTPTVYERYRDRDDILRALRLQTRRDLFAALNRTRTLREAVQRQLEFALEHSHAYEVLFDGVGKPPSLYEPWPSFNLIRERITARLGGTPQQHTRLMLAVWSVMHGAAMLIIRGHFEGTLRTQTVQACVDAVEAILNCAQTKRFPRSGSRWPANLILGEGKKSQVGNGNASRNKKLSRTRK